MNFAKATGKTIQEAFEDFHRENPHVYKKFVELSFRAINKGKKKISFKMIMNVIRWEHYLETNEQTDLFLNGQKTKFKINDAYGSRYARIFAKDYPEHSEKIELRKLRTL